MSDKRGFTLIELLVVIAIIALLMSILMPALNKAQAQAKDALCRSNQHHWGLMWKMWTDENKGFSPSYGETKSIQRVMIDYYEGNLNRELFLCPMATKTFLEGGRNPYMAWGPLDQVKNLDAGMAKYEPVYNIVGSYVMNLWASNDQGSGSTSLEFWRTPNMRGAQYVPIQADGQWMEMQCSPEDNPQPFESSTWTPVGQEMQRVCIKRHGAYYVNLLMMDYSIKRSTIKELWTLRWHREWPVMGTPGNEFPDWPEWMADVPEPL
jgi:prepilin-type N-terminal cleavage/methylation domain-containing protein